MSNNWRGYLIKATKTGTKLPLNLVEKYNSTPNQREEIKAYRDDNSRNLHRITAAGKKTSISFTTIDSISLDEKIALQNFFTLNESNTDERKINLEYWNDETNSYAISDFYRPDINFIIKELSASDIKYDAIEIELIEY